MKKTKAQKGITLIALIITIIVLLILAIVTIKEVQGDGIIAYAKRAKLEQIQKQDEEKILLAFNEWKIVSNTVKDKTFAEFMEEKFGSGNVVENADKSLTVTMESGNKYTVKEDGTITLLEESTPEDTDTPATPDDETGDEGITFTIDGETMTALEGMKWREWISSSYNTKGLTTGYDKAEGEWICTNNGKQIVCGYEEDWWSIGPDDLVVGEYPSYLITNTVLYSQRVDGSWQYEDPSITTVGANITNGKGTTFKVGDIVTAVDVNFEYNHGGDSYSGDMIIIGVDNSGNLKVVTDKVLVVIEAVVTGEDSEYTSIEVTDSLEWYGDFSIDFNTLDSEDLVEENGTFIEMLSNTYDSAANSIALLDSACVDQDEESLERSLKMNALAGDEIICLESEYTEDSEIWLNNEGPYGLKGVFVTNTILQRVDGTWEALIQ